MACPRARASVLRPLVCALAWLCSSMGVRAAPPLLAAELERPSFEYVQARPPDYVRGSLEEVILLGLGFAQYVANHDLNSLDWDFAYTWDGLREKLSPRGYSYDTNGFDTNFIRHPAAGTTYYWAARSNRWSILESLAASVIASTLWEYIGELRERASLNDIIVTPLTGMVLGELTMQLGAFFDRSCELPSNRMLGALLGPTKTLHDLLDGASPLREQRCDRYGLSLRGEHSFELAIMSGVVSTVAGPRTAARPWTRLELHTQIFAVESYGAAGEGIRHFSDGNVSELRLSGSFAGELWNDFSLRGAIMPLGLHQRALTPGKGGLWGHELLFGLVVATEYSVHRFGAWPSGPSRQRDRYFELDIPGASLRYRWHWGALSLTLELQAAAVFVGVDALALPQVRAQLAPPVLPTVTAAEGYAYGLGLRLQPYACLSYRGLQLGAELAAVRAQDITVNDRLAERVDYAQGNERRTLARLWLSAGPAGWPLRLTLQGSWLQRAGVLGGVRAQREELTAAAGFSAVF
jgi:hypothetical protein